MMSIFPVTLEVPETISLSDWGVSSERPARLLVVGDYPSKQLTVTEADIDSLVAHFSEPVPIKVEHIDSPLDPLGVITKLWRDGAALMGQVSFPADIAAVLKNRGIKKLSCGLLKGPDWRLLEASLVVHPHVPSAALLSETTLSDDPKVSDPRDLELIKLRQDLRKQTVDAQIAELKRTGKVIPATEALARVLLSAEDAQVVTLSDGAAQPVSAAFLAYLSAQPPVVTLGELTQLSTPVGSADGMGATGDAAIHLDTDQRAFLERSLGVNPDDVIKTMTADKAKAAQKGMASNPMATTASFPGLAPVHPATEARLGAPTAQQRGA